MLERVLRYCYFSIAFVFLFTIPVYAYVDPSVMTYAIQALAGIAVALGTFFSLYWRKVKKWLIRKMDLNETAKSGYEADDLYYYDLSCMKEARTYTAAAISKENKQEETAAHPLLNELIPALWLAVAGCFMICIYAPLEIYMNNKAEFWFDFYVIFPQSLRMFVIFLVAVIILAVVFRKIGKKAYYGLLITAVIIFICTFIQGTFLVKNMPAMDGRSIDWSSYTADNLVTLFLFLIVSGAVIIGYKKLTRKGFDFVIKAVSSLISVLMVVILVIVAVSTNGMERKTMVHISNRAITEYSNNSNYIVFVLDALDGEEFTDVMASHPEYKEQLKDFTFFPDTMGAYTFTSRAVPHILTGAVYENQTEFRKFATEAMDNSPLFKALESRQYDMGLYECDLVYDNENIKRFENVDYGWVGLNPETKNYFMKQQMFLVMFKYLPYCLKQYVPADVAAFRQLMGDGTFSDINRIFYEDLLDSELTTVENNKFKFIHLEGAHVPYKYDKDLNILPNYDGSYDQNIEASMTLTNYYLNRLKEINAYNNSVIIIMADHGYSDDKEGLDATLDRTNPVLMVKGFNEKHDFVISDQKVSFWNLMESFERLLNGQNAEDAFSIEIDPKGRRFLFFEYEKENHLVEYLQTGNAADIETLVPTGNTYDIK